MKGLERPRGAVLLESTDQGSRPRASPSACGIEAEAPPRGRAALHVWLRVTSRRTLLLCVAVDVPATVVDINDGFSVGLRAVASGARVLGTRGAGSEAGQRRRACM